MQYTAFLLATAAATASAQVTYNSTTGVFTCPADKPDGAFCAGDSLTTNIIIRCTAGVGQPGNCNDNLAGYFPFGVNYAPCWETSATSGDAACSKNCIVEGGSGKSNGTFTLPNCTPTPSPSASTSTTASTTTASSSASTSASSSATTITTTASTTTTTSCSTTSPTTIVTLPPTTTAGPTGGSTFSGNGTFTTVTSAGHTYITPTNTPVGPSGTTTGAPSTFTGAAVANSASFGLAVIGLFGAYFL